MQNAIIYHITTKEQWQQALLAGYYLAPSLQTEGFIHCSTALQVQGVLERYFKQQDNLLKLTIETPKLSSTLQYDFSPSVNEYFPHVYGVINIDAVSKVDEI